jgi:hypothetical protein
MGNGRGNNAGYDILAVVRSLDWAPAEGGNRKPRGFSRRRGGGSRVLPIDVPADIRS